MTRELMAILARRQYGSGNARGEEAEMLVDDAHKILDIYAYFKAEPGHTLISNHFLAIGERRRWTPHELQAGIEEAHRRGWVEEGRGWVLTQAGFDEMERSLQA